MADAPLAPLRLGCSAKLMQLNESVLNLSNLGLGSGRRMGNTLLHESETMSCRLGFYRGGSSQDLHSHPTPFVSLLLCGSVHEAVGRREVSGDPCSISIKPPDVRHRDAYGRNGALILSVAIHDPELWSAAIPKPEWAWHPLTRRDHADLLATLAAADRPCDAAFELLALSSKAPLRKGIPPRWLRLVKEELCDRPDLPLSVAAARAQVHPVYLARAFRAWYGISPCAFRLAQRTSAAIDAGLWSPRAASAIAQDVGFADQSHMARAIRSATGHSLSQLRLLASRSR